MHSVINLLYNIYVFWVLWLLRDIVQTQLSKQVHDLTFHTLSKISYIMPVTLLKNCAYCEGIFFFADVFTGYEP